MGRVVVEVSFPLLVGWFDRRSNRPPLTAEANPWRPLLWPQTHPIDSYSSAAFIHTCLHYLILFSHSYTADEIFFSMAPLEQQWVKVQQKTFTKWSAVPRCKHIVRSNH